MDGGQTIVPLLCSAVGEMGGDALVSLSVKLGAALDDASECAGLMLLVRGWQTLNAPPAHQDRNYMT